MLARKYFVAAQLRLRYRFKKWNDHLYNTA